MRLIRGRHNLKPFAQGCVATIGNFDGMHRGHQAVIEQLLNSARERKLPAVVITFEPLPHEYFAPQANTTRLSRLREKLQFMAEAGVDHVLVLRFDEALATLSAEDFIEQILVSGLNLRHLVIGDDFRFGHQRRGDWSLLQAAGQRHGFDVEQAASHVFMQRRVSSSWVREALAAGDTVLATLLLGRPYAVCGRVAHGDKRGRRIGFPTANIHLHRPASPVRGVFAVEVHGVAEGALRGIANVGYRPTVDGTRTQLEVHLLDFQGDLYGRHLRVDFLQRLREERKFDSLDALTAQIARDEAAARDYFGEQDATLFDY